jgi:hypothetical protein
MNKIGNYSRNASVDNRNVVAPTFSVTKTIVNPTQIRFTIQSNLVNRTINWELTGALSAEFTDTLGLANTAVLSASGTANVVKTINTTPYAANGSVYGNTAITFNVRPGGANAQIKASNTAVINRTVNTPPVITGGTTSVVSTTRFHTFTASNTAVISNVGNNATGNLPASIQAIVVGAGGNAGFAQASTTFAPFITFEAGDGGAGGYIQINQTAALGTYPVIVGIGNAGNFDPVEGQSSFYSSTALGGGRGGTSTADAVTNGFSGGSGGGGGFRYNITTNTRTMMSGGAGTAGQGNAGGGATNADGGCGGGAGSGASPIIPGGGASPVPGAGVAWIDGVTYSRGGGLPTSTTPGSGGRQSAPSGSTDRNGRSGIVKIAYSNIVPTRTISL